MSADGITLALIVIGLLLAVELWQRQMEHRK